MIPPDLDSTVLSSVLLKDRFALRQLQKQLSCCDDNQRTALQQQFDDLYRRSLAVCRMRHEKSLHITYPEQLPVSEKRADIAALIQQHQVVIVAGETGSGKTTQLAKLCLELGRGRDAMIGHTQPRRIAAHSVAARIAEELQLPLGGEIASQVRFQDNSNEHTLLKLMTDGVLLAEIAHDRFLERYDTLIIDEAHERSLNIDFLLGYLKQLLPKRPDLKVIITSATIDVERFSEYFDRAPVITVSGRSYPVDIVYQPIDREQDDALFQGVRQTLTYIDEQERHCTTAHQLGDVLVFLAGEQDIRHCAALLRKSDLPNCDILPLYARLPHAEQQKIFHPSARKASRRVILATNVAETSLTVPGIHYVIDSGLARISRYSHRSKVQRLPVEKISQASANQRAGRCGRIASGICYRLYDEADFQLRPEFTEPEIQRTNLASVILQMQSLKLGDIDRFPFIQPPDQRLINDGVRQLVELAALTEQRKLTDIGRQMALLPVDPKLSRILLAAQKERCLKEALVIVAVLSIQDPREFPVEKREAAREKHQQFRHEQSDFLSFYQLWQYCEEQRQQLSHNQFRKLCQKAFLSEQRIREWRETHSQLKRICQRLSFRENQDDADYASVHKALLTGLLLNVGFQHERRVFSGTRNRIFRLFPGSWLAKKPPKWLMAADLIETSQLYAHCAAQIDPLWLHDVAAHLLKYHYHEPHFSSKKGQVMAWQQASLYGLLIADKRRVGFASVDPVLARQIFIRAGLVEEQLQSKAAFFLHNRQLRQTVEKLEEKSRRRDLLISDEAIFTFYDERIPVSIVNQAGFERWLKKAGQDNPRLLFADQSVFMMNTMSGDANAQFPEQLEWQGIRYKLSYRFEPGHPEDGVSVSVPVAVLNRVPRFLFDWLVPGMLRDKAEALLKTLPKQYRKQLVPIPDTVMQLSADLQAQDKSLPVVLGDLLQSQRKIHIPLDAWQPQTLDNWYKMNIRVLDEQGRLLEQSRDLPLLLKKYAAHVQKALDKENVAEQQKAHYTRWDFDDLPEQHAFRQGGSRLLAYPAIQDEGDKVSIVLTDYPHIQQQVHQKGLIRLAMLELAQQNKYLRKELFGGNALQLKMGSGFDKAVLLDDTLFAAFRQTFFAKGLVWKKAEFQQTLAQHKSELMRHAQALETLVNEIIEQDYQLRMALSALSHSAFAYAQSDAEQQRERLFTAHFIDETPAEHLACYPRYLKALNYRIQRLQAHAPKDKQASQEIQSLQERWLLLQQRQPQSQLLPSVQEYRWLLEEYRVSLFAQQLKTRVPVSRKRLDALWHSIEDDIRRTF